MLGSERGFGGWRGEDRVKDSVALSVTASADGKCGTVGETGVRAGLECTYGVVSGESARRGPRPGSPVLGCTGPGLALRAH
jgi:hypothetical protein